MKRRIYCVFARAKNGHVTHKHFKRFEDAIALAKKVDKKREFTLTTLFCSWNEENGNKNR